MENNIQYETDEKLKQHLLFCTHFRGLKKTSSLTLRIIQYAKEHNLFHENTTVQTYIFYIRNSIFEIPKCRTCNAIIPNLALGVNKVQKFCSKKCQGISQLTGNYEIRCDVTKLNDQDVLKEINSRESCRNITKNPQWVDRLKMYVKKNTKIDPNTVSNYELIHIIKRNLQNLPVCINCGKTVRVVPIYHNKGSLEQKTYQKLCNECSGKTSNYEIQIQKFLDKNNIQYEKNIRSIIPPKELDIWVPTKNLAIEINGLYWHSEAQNTYNKLDDCNKKNIRLIQIYTDELDLKHDIVFYRLRSILQLVRYKIGARECEVKEIESTLKNRFLNKYHIQGTDKSQISLGLFYKNKLVSVMTFALPRRALGYTSSVAGWELSRFASINSFTVIGGASKLFNFFINKYNPGRIFSYCDLRWSTGDVYKKMGFNYVKTTKPNYWYCLYPNYKERLHRFNFRKSVLKNKLKVFDPELSEIQNMYNNNHYRIFDSGHLLFEYLVE